MKRKVLIFLLKVAFLAILLIGVYLLSALKLTKSFVSDDYSKFTHKAGSMILGLSRAHYAMDPQTLEDNLKSVDYAKPFLNFAFEKSQSPYGEVYLEAVKKKIADSVTNGIFILSVTPGSFSVSNRLVNDEDILEFDRQMMIGKVKDLNEDPNLEYVRKCFGRALYKGIFPHEHRLTSVFHSNGWEEFKLEGGGYTITQEDIKFWQKETVEGYTKLAAYIPEYKSSYRMEWFKKTVAYLKTRGRVYILRIPMHPGILALEDGVWPELDTQMEAISSEMNVPYLNYARTGETYQTYDGSHLYSQSAKKLCTEIARTISSNILQ
ncbi:hypothetical protein [Robertkochia solimangrovi]|uniref:hypothetical protein n=1 Tax=Robertkochia solimangrovi TaxID=2213046 RepID=UPI00118018B3|nr:hypothetical protein [Robertkochia solimangrovi]TRZ44198.1 hypothetical protein DMZ48_06705 [Robertkochia solimangrovi]